MKKVVYSKNVFDNILNEFIEEHGGIKKLCHEINKAFIYYVKSYECNDRKKFLITKRKLPKNHTLLRVFFGNGEDWVVCELNPNTPYETIEI